MNDNFGLQVIENNKVVTSSRNVAEVFEKRHDHVLRDIKNLECGDEFRLPNFGESSYINEQNREMPEYLITRDGFTLLAMGFTGTKAMEFKIKYINAFNKMEEQIRSQVAIPDFSDPAYIVQLAQNWLAEKERADYFERTKAQIGSHREATAMATASRAVRRANSAERRLDTALDIIGYGKEWVQVKGISWLKHYFDLNKPGAYSQIGKELKKFSAEFGYEVKKAEDVKYGSVCLFSREAADKFREHLDDAPLLLMNYRGGTPGTCAKAS